MGTKRLLLQLTPERESLRYQLLMLFDMVNWLLTRLCFASRGFFLRNTLGASLGGRCCMLTSCYWLRMRRFILV